MMKNDITRFIASKQLSESSKKAYYYDLQQFVEVVSGKITPEKLSLYEHSLADLKVSAKRRKLSAVNQFLYFLYEQGKLERFYKLNNQEKMVTQPADCSLLDYGCFYQETSQKAGQLIALLIVELGLLPQEIQHLTPADVDSQFAVLRLKRSGMVRILQVPERLLPYLVAQLSEGQYLFDHKGKPYSRQWFFTQLKAFLSTYGFETLSAQDLRQQYILHQKEAGKSILEISKQLGLKSPITLEKYYTS